jgi:hypothetical protein
VLVRLGRFRNDGNIGAILGGAQSNRQADPATGTSYKQSTIFQTMLFHAAILRRLPNCAIDLVNRSIVTVPPL